MPQLRDEGSARFWFLTIVVHEAEHRRGINLDADHADIHVVKAIASAHPELG
jgi:hypothetical protein